ncbi:unnamed protein product [Closterium sp. NIES-53]
MSWQSGSEVEPPQPPPVLAQQQQQQQHQRHRSSQSEEFESAVVAVISRIKIDKPPTSNFESAPKPPLPAAARDPVEFSMGETPTAPRFAPGYQAQLHNDGSTWDNPSAHSPADMIVSPSATAYIRQNRFGAPLVRPSSAGSSRGGSSAAGGSFRVQRGDASPPAFNIPLTTTHTQKQRWPDSHGAQTLSAWLQRTSSSGSGSGSEGKTAQDRAALQRCASAPHERNGGAAVNSDGAPRGGGGEAREMAAALQASGGGIQQETEEERSIKRRLLNREYAKRSRQRQHERFVELEAQVNSMAAEKRAADQRLQEMEQALMILQGENARLRQIASGRYSRDMAEILRAIQQAGGFPAEAAAGLFNAGGGVPAGGPAAQVVAPPQTGFAPDARGFLEEGASASASASAAAAAAADARADLRFNAAGAFPGASSYQEIGLEGIDNGTAIGGNWPRSASAPSAEIGAELAPAREHASGAHAQPAPDRQRGTFPPPPPAQAFPSVQGFFGQPGQVRLGGGDSMLGDFSATEDKNEMMIFAAAAASAAAASSAPAPAAPAGNPRSFDSFATGSGHASSGAFSGVFSAAAAATTAVNPIPGADYNPRDSGFGNIFSTGFPGNTRATGPSLNHHSNPAFPGSTNAAFNSAFLGFGTPDLDVPLGGDEDTAALLAVAGLVGGNGRSVERSMPGGAKEGAELGYGMEEGGGEGGERVEGSSCGGVGQGSGGEWNEHEGTLFAMIHHLHRQL